MSLLTWMDEFYKEDADRVAERGSVLECIDNSLSKWIGLRKGNLEKHDCHVYTYHGNVLDNTGGVFISDREGVSLVINCKTCALCQLFDAFGDGDCNDCPIVKVTGHDCEYEYDEFYRNHNPEPMIKLLMLVKEEEDGQN